MTNRVTLTRIQNSARDIKNIYTIVAAAVAVAHFTLKNYLFKALINFTTRSSNCCFLIQTRILG